MVMNTRSGIDGGEHSAMLDCVMAVRVDLAGHPCHLLAHLRAEIRVTITRRSRAHRAAYTAAYTGHGVHLSPARHDVNDPNRFSVGPPTTRDTGVAHVMAC